MKEKNLKELYQILLSKIDLLDNDKTSSIEESYLDVHSEIGICNLIILLANGEWVVKNNCWNKERYLNYNEVNVLQKDFLNRKPKWYNSLFWWNPNFNKFSNNGYWWKLNKKGNKQRKLFIENIIKNL